jgi:hypothetical protein
LCSIFEVYHLLDVTWKFHNLFIAHAFVSVKHLQQLGYVDRHVTMAEASFYDSATSPHYCSKTDTLGYKNRLCSACNSRSLLGSNDGVSPDPLTVSATNAEIHMLRTLSYDIHDQCRRVIERDSKKRRIFNGADAWLQAPEDQIFPSVESLKTAGVYATSANTYLVAHVAFGRRRAKNNGIVAVNPSHGVCSHSTIPCSAVAERSTWGTRARGAVPTLEVMIDGFVITGQCLFTYTHYKRS